MKILHVPYCFHPDPVGGTEVFVEGLVAALSRGRHAVEVVAPGQRMETYKHRNVCVTRFPVGSPSLRELYGEGDPAAAEAFGRVLDQGAPDLVHLHAFTSAISVRLVRECKKRGIPVVFTYHTPTVSCQRGTMLHWGEAVCDGALHVQGCSRCTLHGHGLPKTVSSILGSLPTGIGGTLGSLGLSGGPFTALRMTELVSLRHSALRKFLAEVDQVVAVCGWVKQVLLRIGVPEQKVTLSRQGLGEVDSIPERETRHELPRRLAFLGRIHPTKGLHVLIRALRTRPDLPVCLDVYGIAQGREGESYLAQLREQIGKDSRIRILAPVAGRDVVRTLSGYDALAVPSQWLETGPLVVYEAFAAGIPVIGSNLGGIAELVQDGVNGVLVDPGSVDSWQAALSGLVHDSELWKTLRSGVSAPRLMSDVAGEMQDLYARVLAGRHAEAKAHSLHPIH